MKILLVGGTGTISGAISELLIQQGHELWLLNRGNSALPDGARHLPANMDDKTEVAAKLAGHTFDAVADFIVFTPGQAERDIRLFSGITKQYIFVSSASAYQKPPKTPVITEETPLENPYWQYSRDKIACEELFTAQYTRNGFPVTIVRPSHTYSRNGVPLALHGDAGTWPVLKRMIEGKPVIIHGDGSSLWTLTDSRDFARAFAGLLGLSAAIGEAVHITSDESLTWNQIYQTAAVALGTELKPVYVPSVTLVSAGAAEGYDFAGTLLGDKSNSVRFDTGKIKRLVPGFAAKIPFATGVRDTIAHLFAHPKLQKEDPKFDAFCDKMAAAMARINRGT